MMFSARSFNIVGFLCMLSVGVHAQSGMVAGGGDVKTTQGSVSCSIGQVDYPTVISEEGSAMAGMQQAYIKYKEAEETKNGVIQREVLMSVYPNPTKDRCHVSIPQCTIQLHYVISDLTGKRYDSGWVTDDSWVSFESLLVGTYLLSIYQENTLLTTFKIIKE